MSLVDSISFLSKWTMASSCAGVLLISILLTRITTDGWGIFRKSLRWFCLADSILVIAQAVIGVQVGINHGGFLGESSMNGMLIGILLPFVFPLWWAVPISVVALFIANSSTAIGAACISVAAAALAFEWLMAPAAIVMGGTLSVVAFLIQGEELFHFEDRWEGWQRAWAWFFAQDFSTIAFGTGTGSLLTKAAYILGQMPDGNFWWHLHSEWLRVILEQGMCGFFLWTIAAVSILIAAVKKDAASFGALAAALAMCAVQYPFNMPGHTLIIAGIAFMVSRKQ